MQSLRAQCLPLWRLAGRQVRRDRIFRLIQPWLCLVLLAFPLWGCGSEPAQSDAGPTAGDHGRPDHAGRGGRGGPGGGGRRGGPGGFAMMGDFPGGGGEGSNSIPVEVAPVLRRSIAQYLETNGSLEAENEVDIVSRISGPIVELLVEEGMTVEEGQLLARIDDRELRTQLELATVNLEDTRLSLRRAQVSLDNAILSQELFDQTKSRFDSSEAQVKSSQIQLSYTEIKAPFSGLIIQREVKFAQHVSNNTKLFRISDFDPLLCPIQVPEKDLPKLGLGQPAYLTVEAFPDERFGARVLRISPVVDAATGTVKVTLEVKGPGRLRPGMFASIFLETDRRQGTLVVPKKALVLESIGDTVYVYKDGLAARREVRLGYDEADFVEVLEGVGEGEKIIVVGQDGVSDGTPVYVLEERRGDPAVTWGPPGMPDRAGGPTRREGHEAPPSPPGDPRQAASPGNQPVQSGNELANAPGGQVPEAGGQGSGSPGPRTGRGDGLPGGPGFGGRGRPDFSQMTPEQLERVKERMRGRGFSDEQIEGILKGQRPMGPPGGQP